jgi:hypothetical protein
MRRHNFRRLTSCIAFAALVLMSPHLAAAPDAIVSANYANPVTRYGHFAAGPPHEYSRIEAKTAQGQVLAHELPADEVFEDIVPRQVRLSAGAPTSLLAIVSHREQGSALALLGIEGGKLEIVARSKAIGSPFRWLNPVAVLDLDGDGEAEIAAVITPHIGGTLKIYRRYGRRLQEVAALGGFSNHAYGSAELGLSTARNVGPRPQLLVPDASRTALRIIEFRGGNLLEVGRCQLPAPVAGPVVATSGADVDVSLRGGIQRLTPKNCLF